MARVKIERRPLVVAGLRRGRAALPLLVVTALGLAVLGFGGVSAAPDTRGARMAVTLAPGESRADPIPFKQEAQAGPWRLAVTDVVTGQAATDQVTQASKFNSPPAQGEIYVLVKIRATNAGDRPLQIGGDDFGLVGSSGIVHRFVGAFPPDPALDKVLKPGESNEGWVVLGAAASDQNLLLLFDSVSLPGSWADRVFALQPNAKIPDATTPAAKPDANGTSFDKAVALNTPVTTADWQVEILKVLTGMDVYNLYPQSDYRTTALGTADAQTWLALQIKATNVRTGGQAAYFPATAFRLADERGNVVPDVEWLTPPDPDIAGWYYPGASRDGWVVFEVPSGYGGSVVQFLPFLTDHDPRYLAFGQASVPSTAAAGTAPAKNFAQGTTVTVTDSGVHLRNQPSIDGAVVETLNQGTKLQITGAPQQANGYTWYPVKDTSTGATGYVASDYLR